MTREPMALPGPALADVPVAVASAGAAWEIDLIPAIDAHRSGLHLLRRCVDLADLLAVGHAGLIQVAIVSADLSRLDRDHVVRLRADGVAVLLVEDDETAGRCLQLGVSDVVTSTTPPGDVVAQVRALADRSAEPVAAPPVPIENTTPRAGQLVAVWGPAGSPGRSTLALNLANEAALAGCPTLLVDADVAGGALSSRLGVLDEAPGLAAAARSAARGRLSTSLLAAQAVTVADGLRLLTGDTRPDRWRELRPAAIETVCDTSRHLGDLVVVDLGAAMTGADVDRLPGSGAGPDDVSATVVGLADEVVVVASPDPLGMLRLVHGLDQLSALAPQAQPVVVVNRMRERVVGRNAARQVRETVERFAGSVEVVLLPDDPKATDDSLRTATPLSAVAPASALRAGIVGLLGRLHPPATAPGGRPAGASRRGRRRASVPSRG